MLGVGDIGCRHQDNLLSSATPPLAEIRLCRREMFLRKFVRLDLWRVFNHKPKKEGDKLHREQQVVVDSRLTGERLDLVLGR